MQEQEFKILIDRYLNDALTPNEIEDFFTLVLSGDYDHLLSESFLKGLQQNRDLRAGIPHDVSDTIIRNIMSSENFAKNTIIKSVPVKRFNRYLVAASIILLVISSYFIKTLILGDSNLLPNGIAKSAYNYKDNLTKSPIKVILEDGSQVTLQPFAKLYYSVKQSHKREVFLEGDAFFDVTKNKEAPFFVYSGAIVTKVLGTSFNITNPVNGNTEVLVKSGRVQVYENINKGKGTQNSLQPVILQPNHKVIFHAENKTLELTLAEKPELIKKTNGYTSVDSSKVEFVYVRARVRDVLKELEHHYGIEIIVPNEDLYNCYFTGDITEQDLYTKLKMICLTTNTNYEINGTKILITGSGLHVK